MSPSSGGPSPTRLAVAGVVAAGLAVGLALVGAPPSEPPGVRAPAPPEPQAAPARPVAGPPPLPPPTEGPAAARPVRRVHIPDRARPSPFAAPDPFTLVAEIEVLASLVEALDACPWPAYGDDPALEGPLADLRAHQREVLEGLLSADAEEQLARREEISAHIVVLRRRLDKDGCAAD